MKIRRIVTGHNAQGKSIVKWDSELESQSGRPGFEQVLLWATDRLPPQRTDADPHTWELGTSLANGSVLPQEAVDKPTRFGQYLAAQHTLPRTT